MSTAITVLKSVLKFVSTPAAILILFTVHKKAAQIVKKITDEINRLYRK